MTKLSIANLVDNTATTANDKTRTNGALAQHALSGDRDFEFKFRNRSGRKIIESQLASGDSGGVNGRSNRTGKI